jgi:hypothetical protein
MGKLIGGSAAAVVVAIKMANNALSLDEASARI